MSPYPLISVPCIFLHLLIVVHLQNHTPRYTLRSAITTSSCVPAADRQAMLYTLLVMVVQVA